MPAGPLCYATNTISENIPNIWHKSSTKHKEVRQIETVQKLDNANYAPSYHMEEFYQWQFFILKNIRSSARKDLDCELFYFWTKTSQRLTLYLLSYADNIHIVLENDNTVLIKRT